MSMVVPFLPMFIKVLGVTDPHELQRWSGLVVSGVFITAAIATPFWGWIGDRVGKKKMVIRAIFGLSVSMFVIGLSANVMQLFLFRLLQGVLSGFIASALALVSANTPKERSGFAIGFLATSSAAGTLLGPFAGGFMADSFGYRSVFFITAGLCFISGLLILFFVREINPSENYKNNFIQNFKFVTLDRNIKYAMITLIVSSAAISMIQPLFALFIEERIGSIKFFATLTGAIFGISGIFEVIASPLWGKRNDRMGYKKNLSYALIGAGIAYALHIIPYGVWGLIPVRMFLGFCIGGILPSLYSFINKCTPLERKGTVIGIAAGVTMFGGLIGPLLSGFMAPHTGISFIFILSGMILAVSALLVLPLKDVIYSINDKEAVVSAESDYNPLVNEQVK